MKVTKTKDNEIFNAKNLIIRIETKGEENFLKSLFSLVSTIPEALHDPMNGDWNITYSQRMLNRISEVLEE